MDSLVIQGDYKHWRVVNHKKYENLFLEGYSEFKELSRDNIKKYDTVHIEYKKSSIDIIIRIIIGGCLVGIIGVLAGFTASNTYEAYRLVSIEFEDGKKSLIKMNKKEFRYLLESIY